MKEDAIKEILNGVNKKNSKSIIIVTDSKLTLEGINIIKCNNENLIPTAHGIHKFQNDHLTLVISNDTINFNSIINCSKRYSNLKYISISDEENFESFNFKDEEILLATGIKFISVGNLNDVDSSIKLLDKVFEHEGFSFVNFISVPKKIKTFKIEELSTYSPKNKIWTHAILNMDHKQKVPIGVYYEVKETPSSSKNSNLILTDEETNQKIELLINSLK